MIAKFMLRLVRFAKLNKLAQPLCRECSGTTPSNQCLEAMLVATVLLTIVTLASSMTITIASHSLPSFLITIAATATFPVQAQFPFHHFYYLYFGMNIAHHAQSQVSDSPPELGHLDRQGEDLPSVLPVAWLNGLGKLKAQESDVWRFLARSM